MAPVVANAQKRVHTDLLAQQILCTTGPHCTALFHAGAGAVETEQPHAVVVSLPKSSITRGRAENGGQHQHQLTRR